MLLKHEGGVLKTMDPAKVPEICGPALGSLIQRTYHINASWAVLEESFGSYREGVVLHSVPRKGPKF